MLAKLSKLLKLASPGPPAPDPSRYAPEVVDGLCARMTEPQCIKWACESCRLVSGDLTPIDTEALGAAESWLSTPGGDAAFVASQAASAAGHAGPGSWAAQAAAWTEAPRDMPTQATQTLPGGSLTAAAAAGSVKMAAAIAAGQPPSTPTPAQAIAMAGDNAPDAALPVTSASESQLIAHARALKPFIDRGNEILAAG